MTEAYFFLYMTSFELFLRIPFLLNTSLREAALICNCASIWYFAQISLGETLITAIQQQLITFGDNPSLVMNFNF